MAPNGVSAARTRPRLVLASASPRRRDLLAAVGVCPEVVVADVDERPFADEDPTGLVQRLAKAKATTVAGRLGPDTPSAVVIGADTVVAIDNDILGKPDSDDEARAMLARLSGRSHRVLTGVAVATAEGCEVATDETTVWFRPLEPADIERYIATGETQGKAGAYGIQGPAGLFVERIEGSYPNVVGLPVHVLDRLCSAAGWPLVGWAGWAGCP